MNKYKAMKHLCEVTDYVFALTLNKFDHFKTEKDVAKFIEKQFKRFNVKRAFPTIVANNSAVIHLKPRKKRLGRGFVIIDMGCRDKGISCDMTRTIFIGKPNAKEKKLYDLIMVCQEKCCKMVKAGVYGDHLDKHARKLLGKYTKYFVHSLGHGVGEKIHQKPRISSKKHDIVKKGDFITIEPGIYIKTNNKNRNKNIKNETKIRNKNKNEIGIRIEDTIYVENETEILTKLPKDLICVDLKKRVKQLQ